MSKRSRQIAIGASAALLLATASVMPGPRADIRILTADEADLDPHQLQAAFDVGMVAVSVIVTWTSSFNR
jgi:hypothetical protein